MSNGLRSWFVTSQTTLDGGRGGNVVLPAAVGQNLSTAVRGIDYDYDGLNDLNHVMPADCVSPVEEILCMWNLDAMFILQRPKLSPHKESIRDNLSLLLGADPSIVNLKAKTHEKVDSLGENRNIAAHTIVLMMKK
ncbi:hypothetical protein E3N88_26114 [Mikania micrantha]|uniref:2-C-methyl-D-erythritol 2,4-cyclodiphosphate synthase domain-containing protein n=1 Tax=Mikania micrantha TaxID=192012 RepID=A0A5N6N6M2_9ASTR|nr:hypothetical protein E3N88_26114 [Mikania micrantha]